MANSNKRKSLFYLVLFAVCLCFFNVSCGLDVLKEVLEDPYRSGDTPNSESNFENCYFKFQILDRNLNSDYSFGQASIYYKIYNDSVKASSEESSLISAADDSVRKLTSLTTMTSYGYKELQYMDADEKIHSFDLPEGKHTIWIRLTTYDDSLEAYSAGIFVDDQKYGIPIRRNGKTFDFGRSGTYDENPSMTHDENNELDSDTKGFVDKQADGEENIYYVVLFGAFQALDNDFETVTSPIHHLGRVKIDANTEKN